MNRTQRALKRANKKAVLDLKRQTKKAVRERIDSNYDNAKKTAKIKELIKEEKDLRRWGRKITSGHACRNTLKEALTA